MNPIRQILNHDDRREFQDVDEDSVVTKFIDKFVTASILNENEYPELHKLVTSVQTHSHTQTCCK